MARYITTCAHALGITAPTATVEFDADDADAHAVVVELRLIRREHVTTQATGGRNRESDGHN
jgi:hypothetical protein